MVPDTLPAVVLDKSFLHGTPTREIRHLAETRRLLMPDVLFYELLSAPEPKRSRCFAKLGPDQNPVVLLQHLGGLLRGELDLQRPCGLPSENVLDLRFQFNKDLANPGYRLPEEARQALDEQTTALKTEIARFLDRSRIVKALFPSLLAGSNEEQKELYSQAETAIADRAQMHGFYAAMVKASEGTMPLPPPASKVDERWAVYRLQQVSLLFGLDTYRRLGYAGLPTNPAGKSYERIEHDVLDAHYLILGVLEGSLATQEKKLQQWFRLLRPDGTLYTYSQDSGQVTSV